jgi:hypothetical protein
LREGRGFNVVSLDACRKLGCVVDRLLLLVMKRIHIYRMLGVSPSFINQASLVNYLSFWGGENIAFCPKEGPENHAISLCCLFLIVCILEIIDEA